MENLHGVDVSWLHRSTAPPKSPPQSEAKTAQPLAPKPQNGPPSGNSEQESRPGSDNRANNNGKLAEQHPPQPPAQPGSTKGPPRRPGLLSRLSSDKSSTPTTSEEAKPLPKKSSWRSLGSKFSSTQASAKSSTPPSTLHADSKSTASPNVSQAKAIPNVKDKEPQEEAVEDGDPAPLNSLSPKSSNFLSSALRRLSSSSSTGSTQAVPVGQVPPCERKVLNIDEGRERSTVKELDESKLRRVSFSVDVEIAGNSRYPAEESAEVAEDPVVKKAKKKDKKLKERAEGEALKNQNFIKQADRGGGVLNALGRDGMFDIGLSDDNDDVPPPNPASPPASPKPSESKPANAVKDKEMATPVSPPQPPASPPAAPPKDLPTDDPATAAADNTTQTSKDLNVNTIDPLDPSDAKSASKPNDKPTTDPLRIYRRCCQLREAPVLKRISEQLGNLTNCSQDNPGIITCLDLCKSRMQLTDVVCLGDWLAVVPVKKLLLEDANLTDEGVRVILAGLLAAKPPELNKRKRGRSSPTRLRDNTIHRSPGLIERLSLKNNPKLTSVGWKHISLFLHLSKSIKAVDVSMNPFPPTKVAIRSEFSPENANNDPAHLLYEALAQRRGDQLEELILAECNLTSHQISKISEAASKIKLQRLGLAGNDIDVEALKHISSYLKAHVCKGLDIGGNDLRENLPLILEALDDQNPIWALCFANCNLDASSMKPLFTAVLRLPDIRFLDFSHNRELFSEQQPTALPYLRKYLPQLPLLKRIHLMDIGLSPADMIAIAEILPEVRNLAHISVLENAQIAAIVSAKDSVSQEEACALYASIMTAVRLSKTLLCVDIDVPTSESSEIVKALARQVIAYCLRNMERYSSSDVIRVADAAAALPDISDADSDTGILGRITGPSAGDAEGDPLHEPTQNDAFITGGTGWMKALNYILDAASFRRFSTAGDQSPTPALAAGQTSKAKEVTKTLIEVARNIKGRAEAAIAREEKAGANDEVLRRLQFLHLALNNIIQRFEDEYPDCRGPDITSTGTPVEPYSKTRQSPPEAEAIDTSVSPSGSRESSTSRPSEGSELSSTYEHPASALDDFFDNLSSTSHLNASSNRDAMAHRRGSETEVHNRALTNEEGQMHKIGQRIRREILPPAGQRDVLHGTSEKDIEPEHLAKLRSRLEQYGGDEIKRKFREEGVEGVLKELDLAKAPEQK